MSFIQTDAKGALVYVGLGSNLCQPVEQIRRGVAAVADLAGCTLLACSEFYASSPMGPKDQPDYVNAVMSLESLLSPGSLLSELQAIESRQGRVRSGVRWGARTLDLDILMVGQEIIETADLVVPHIGIAERAFVLYPLAEIAPGVVIPGKGAIADLLQDCPKDGLTQIA